MYQLHTQNKKLIYYVVDVAPITFIATSICRSFVVKLLDIIAFSYNNSPHIEKEGNSRT